MDPRDRIILITGGARIGQAVAQALVDRGSHIALVYRKSKRSAEAVLDYAETRGRQALAIKADLTLEKDLADIIPKVKRVFGHLDILINMASTYERTPLKRLDLKRWRQSIDSNLKHVYYLSLKVAPLMRAHGEGRIVNFGDWTTPSERPRYKDFLPYYVAKSALKGLTEALALELAPEILVNAIAPGPIIPPARGVSAKENREVIRATPLKRWGGAEEVAKAVLFLVESNFITGECIRVDGGRHLY